MQISRIQKTKQGRFSLFDEDDCFLFSVDDETLFKNHIKEGTSLTESALMALREQSDTRKAKNKALGYLSLRDYASKELFDKLRLKFDDETAAAAVAEMQRLELLNDENFARHRAKYLAAQKKSTREIKRQLTLKGIDRDTADAVLAELCPADDDACYALIQKSYLRKLQADETDKVIAALARRGFAYGAIKAAIERCKIEFDYDEFE